MFHHSAQYHKCVVHIDCSIPVLSNALSSPDAAQFLCLTMINSTTHFTLCLYVSLIRHESYLISEPRIFKKLVKQARKASVVPQRSAVYFVDIVIVSMTTKGKYGLKTVKRMSTRKYIWVCAQFLLLCVNLFLTSFKSLEFSNSEHFSKMHLRYLKKVMLCVCSVCYPAEDKIQLNSNRILTNKTVKFAYNKQYC